MKAIRFAQCDEDLRRCVGRTMGEVAQWHVCLDDGFMLIALEGGRLDRPR